MVFSFRDCEVDVARRELRRNGRVIHVEPQVFDVLLLLVTNRHRVVSKQELLDDVWRGRFVSEATLSSRIHAVREAIGDIGRKDACVRTVPRRGFRFDGAVEERAAPAVAPEWGAPRVGEPATNVPHAVTALIGRDRDLQRIPELLARGRLVTLTGVGGVGKTRLAMQAAHRAVSQFPDGVWWVELAAVEEAGAVAPTVTGVLGIVPQPGKTVEQAVVDSLRPRRLLLVLDNCEHLVDTVATLAQTILLRASHVKILATSREALAIDGEQIWPVAPLESGAATSPAVQLFLERAEAVAPDALHDANTPIVTDICRRLDGIPLAIELAAARVRSLSLAQIRDRLAEGLDLLTGARQPAGARHLTLRRTIQWSYDLLSPAEQALFARLSVFADGCTLEAAEQVCGEGLGVGAPVDLLDSLVRKSLVIARRDATGVRHLQLEIIRQFAAERLAAAGDADVILARHARYFADESGRQFETWLSPRQVEAYRWLEAELPNLRAAFRWGVSGNEIDVSIRIASHTGDMARGRLRDEATGWAAQVVDRARDVHHPRLIVLLTWAASSAWSLGQLAHATRHGQEAVSLLADEHVDPFVWAFTDLAMVAAYEGQFDRAVALARDGAHHHADARDRFCLAMYPYFLAVAWRTEEAAAISDDTVRTVEGAGIPSSICAPHWARAKAYAASSTTTAIVACERAIAVARESGNRWFELLAIVDLAALQAQSGGRTEALRSFQEVIGTCRRSPDVLFASHGLSSLMVLFERLGRLEPAAVLHGAIIETTGSKALTPELAVVVERLRQRLGDSACDDATSRGGRMELHDAYDFALGEVLTALQEDGA